KVRRKPRRAFDLFPLRVHKKTHARADVLQSRNGFAQRGLVAHAVKPPLGGDLLAVFRNDAGVRRRDVESDRHDLGRVAHLEIQLRVDLFAEPENVLVLYVPAVGPKVRGDARRAAALGGESRRHRVGFGIWSLGHGPIARLPKRGDMVDVYTKMNHEITSSSSSSSPLSRPWKGRSR